jgi:ketosteroid isomerase-like protein
MIGAIVTNADIFRSYLERFSKGDVDGAAELLAEDFTFNGPILQSTGRAAFLSGSATAAAMARGCEIQRQWVDGDTVCSIYDFKVETPVGAGSIPMAEWSVIKGGKLVSSRLIFDTADMAALMPPA